VSNSDAVQVVAAFHRHLNAREVDALLGLAADDVRVGGPRGTGSGRALLAEWVGRASIILTPQRWFQAGENVVVEQRATWQDPNGEETGSQTVATVFEIVDGRIAAIARYGFLGEAVTSAGMDESNEIQPPA